MDSKGVLGKLSDDNLISVLELRKFVDSVYQINELKNGDLEFFTKVSLLYGDDLWIRNSSKIRIELNRSDSPVIKFVSLNSMVNKIGFDRLSSSVNSMRCLDKKTLVVFGSSENIGDFVIWFKSFEETTNLM